MLKHYFKIAYRNMLKQKMYSAIKVGGFAIGIAACILIALLIRNELSYDRQVKNGENIYRLIGEFNNKGKMEYGVDFPAPMAKVIKTDFPEVEKTGRLMPSSLFYGAGSNQLRSAEKVDNSYEEGFCFADQEMMDILSIPMVYGDRLSALAKPNTIVISKSKADKFFPGENPVGKLMILNDDVANPYKIGGVMQDFPATSHLQFCYFLTMTGKSLWKGEQDTWMASNYGTYIQLKPGTDTKQFEKKLTSTIIHKYYLPVMKAAGMTDAEDIISKGKLIVQPLHDIHLKSYNFFDWQTRGDIRFVWMFGAVAIFILLIACINFLNLSTARSAKRAKEVGLRKVVGSLKKQLIKQFLVESILYSVLSFLIAAVLAVVLLPVLNDIAAKQLIMPWSSWWFIPALLLSSLFVGVLAGIYPSFYLSAFKPINVLKGNLSLGSKNARLRSVLVVFQFTTSIILLIGTFVIYRQMEYILNARVGFDKDQVVMIQGTGSLGEKTAAFKEELLNLQAVKNVSVSDYLPVTGTKRNGNTFWKEGKITEEAGVSGQRWIVDADYIPTLGMKLIAGRNFSKEMRTDSNAIIINKAMADQLGYKDPIGKIITNGDNFRVIGVVDNFHFETMKQRVQPLCLNLGNSTDVVSVKINSSATSQVLAAIGSTWKKFAPHMTFRYVFMDESFAAMYADVQRTGTIFTGFSILAIIVACLGLFALAAYMAEQRSKEMSIRKILGASISTLFATLTGNFLKLILISLLIGVPLAWWIMNGWLRDFAYRISIGWEVVVFSAITIVFISLLTICYQAIKAAIANPIKSLRSE
jgi:putative ABC transport system permease protein